MNFPIRWIFKSTRHSILRDVILDIKVSQAIGNSVPTAVKRFNLINRSLIDIARYNYIRMMMGALQIMAFSSVMNCLEIPNIQILNNSCVTVQQIWLSILISNIKVLEILTGYLPKWSWDKMSINMVIQSTMPKPVVSLSLRARNRSNLKNKFRIKISY